MANPTNPNPNIIDEAEFLRDLESGKIQEADRAPIVVGAGPSAPPTLPSQGIPFGSGSLPASMQLPTDLVRALHDHPGVPTNRLWPVAPAGQSGTVSAVVSGTKKISETVKQTSTVIASQPIVTTSTDPTGTPIVHVTPPLPGPPRPRLPVTPTHVPAVNTTALTSGNIDFTKTGFVGKNQDNVADTATFVRLAATHAAGNVSYNFKGAWSSATSYVIADEVTFNNIYWIALAANTNSQPSISNANWQAVGRIQGDLQIFTASGTWSKPAAGTFAVITVIGGGAGGFSGNAAAGTANGGNGGFPGGISFQILPLSALGATESITVGGGGTAGNAGTASSFGVWLQATGGTGSAVGNGNVPNGTLSMYGGRGGAGGSASSTTGTFGSGATGGSGASARQTPFAGGAGGTSIGQAGASGTNASTDEPSGGAGGGGGAGNESISGGTVTGGAGGAGGNYGGGGGGGGAASTTGTGTGGTGGAGAPGIVIIAVY